jgi:hypothetical protein
VGGWAGALGEVWTAAKGASGLGAGCSQAGLGKPQALKGPPPEAAHRRTALTVAAQAHHNGVVAARRHTRGSGVRHPSTGPGAAAGKGN